MLKTIFVLVTFAISSVIYAQTTVKNTAACSIYLKIADYDLAAIEKKAPELLDGNAHEWVENGVQYALRSGERAELKITNHQRVLTLPADLQKSVKARYVLQWLVGSKFHPYNSGKIATERYIRYEQIESVNAISEFLVSNKRRLQVIAPPGFGKTFVVRRLLHDWRTETSALKTLVIADRLVNLDQNAKELRYDDLQTFAEASKFLSASALRNLWQAKSMQEKRDFVKDLDLIVYDEGHHSAAPVMGQVLDEVQALNTHVKLVGLSATPANSFRDLQAFYGNNSYWAYLDRSPHYDEVRQPMMVVDQLLEAMNRGHLTPFRNFFLLNDEMLGVQDLFVKPNDQMGREGNFFVINPAHYQILADFLKPTVDRSQKIAVIANTIDEAERLKQVFESQKFPYAIRVIHSRMKKADAQAEFEKFKNAKYREIMIAVNMLDEAADIPDLDLLIDLNRTASANEALQRLGRLTRLAPQKTGVDVVAFFQITASNLRDLIELLDRLHRGRKARVTDKSEFNIVDTTGHTLNSFTEEEIWQRLAKAAYEFQSTRLTEAPGFLLYPTIEEASAAAIKLNIKNPNDYKEKYRRDSRLPQNPLQFYADQWSDWYHFLGVQRTQFYKNFEDFKLAINVLKISNSNQYLERRHLDPQLPPNPERVFREFTTWREIAESFRENFYTYEEARGVVASAKATTPQSYALLRERDSKLPTYPDDFYQGEFVSWEHFLQPPRYNTAERALDAVRRLDIKTQSEYQKRHSEDSRLPDDPHLYYPDWPTTDVFPVVSLHYETLDEAKAAVRKLHIVSWPEYKERFSEDPKLPPNPSRQYKDWKGISDYFGYELSGLTDENFYRTYEEARDIARKYKFSGPSDYFSKRRDLDRRLPSRPPAQYGDTFQGWYDYLGLPGIDLKFEKTKIYKDIENASAAAFALGFKTKQEYWRGRMADRRLPPKPETFYDAFTTWEDFLKLKDSSAEPKIIEGEIYSYEDAEIELRSRRIYTRADYLKLARVDHRFAPDPESYYDKFYTWYVFLGNWNYDASSEYYKTLAEARDAAQKLGIKTGDDYRANYHRDRKLPKDPATYYKIEWISFLDFLHGSSKNGRRWR